MSSVTNNPLEPSQLPLYKAAQELKSIIKDGHKISTDLPDGTSAKEILNLIKAHNKASQQENTSTPQGSSKSLADNNFTLKDSEDSDLPPGQNPLIDQHPTASPTTPPVPRKNASTPTSENLHKKHTYTNITVNDDQTITTTKINNHTKEVITRTYDSTKLAEGGFGIAFKLTPTDSQGKSKVIKISHGTTPEQQALAQKLLGAGDEILKEQLVHPETGKPLTHVPGLMKGYKSSDISEGALLTKYDGTITPIDDDDHDIELPSFRDSSQAFAQLAFGLHHLQQSGENKPGRMHGDIKPENVFYREVKNEKGEMVKEFVLADMDGAKKLGFAMGKGPVAFSMSHVCIHDLKLLVPPKVLAGEAEKLGIQPDMLDEIPAADVNAEDPQEVAAFYKSIDVYALGITMAQYSLDLPYRFFTANESGELDPVAFEEPVDAEGSPLYTEEQVGQATEMVALMNQMMSADWRERPTTEQVLNRLSELGIPLPTYPKG
jgi:hypothetical protein